MLGKWAIMGLTPRLAALTSPKRKPNVALASHSPAFACQVVIARWAGPAAAFDERGSYADLQVGEVWLVEPG
jgi:hypothetical protein